MRALILVALVSGCVTSQVTTKNTEPLSYQQEIKQAVSVTAAQPKVVVRYNPVRCACPPFELQVGSRWVRLALEDVGDAASPAAQFLVRAKADAKTGGIQHYAVIGEVDTSLSTCGQGTLYLSIAVQSLE